MNYISSTCLRYAKSIFNIAKKKGIMNEILLQLNEFSNLLKKEEKIFKSLINPCIPVKIKEELISKIAEKMGMDEILKSFLKIILDKSRIDFINTIVLSYKKLFDEDEGLLRAKISTAFPLSEDEMKLLILKLENIFGKKIVVDIEINEDLIYGVVTTIEDKVFDGSLKTYLSSLKKQLTLE